MPVILKKNYSRPISTIDLEVQERLLRNETATFLYIAPTNRKVRDLKREFLLRIPGGTAPAFHLFTLETLVARLFAALCPPRRFVAGPLLAVLMEEAVRSVAPDLAYIQLRGRQQRLPKGTLQKIIDVITTLKEEGVYRTSLHAEIEAAGGTERPKLEDILRIYEAFDAILGETYVDAPGMFKALNETWEAETAATAVQNLFPGLDSVIVSGFDEFSDPELAMLYNLSSIPGIGMLVSFDYHLDNDEIFGHLKENYKKFISMGFQKTSAPPGDLQSFVQHITQYLFRYGDDLPVHRCRDQVTILQASDREAEVASIAKIIKDLVRKNPNRDLSRICVAMYRPQTYTNLFREVFERFGIAANITDRYSLDQSPLVVSAVALLAVQQNGFRIQDIMRALSSPYLRLEGETGPLDAGNLYAVATRLKLAGGEKAWFSRIDQRLAILATRIAAAEDGAEEEEMQHEESMLRKARADLSALGLILERFKGRMTPREFRRRLVGLLDSCGVVDGLLGGRAILTDQEQLERDTRAYEKFLGFIDDFMEILALEGRRSTPEPLSFYLERLRTAIAQVRYNIRQKYGHGVVVTSFDETRGLKFDVMIIAGLVDGEFPPAYEPEIFFTPERRMRQERRHLHELRYLFYQALTNFSEHLYLLVPRSDKSLDLVPSSFLDALTKILELEDLRGVDGGTIAGMIASEDELLRSLGQAIGAGADEAACRSVLNRAGAGAALSSTLDQARYAMRVELSRAGRRTDMAEWNGIIADSLSPDARRVLDGYRSRRYSVTQLESYGTCPFQFFSGRVLRLAPAGELEETLSPLERGGVLHEILFEFYISRRERGLPPLFDTGDDEFRTAVADLIALGRRKLDELQIPDPFWGVEKEMILGAENREGLLSRFLSKERETVLGVSPSFFEVTFGSAMGRRRISDPALAHTNPVVAGSVELRGKVDRIDIGDGFFRIVDYKTGSREFDAEEMAIGTSLQLPLYLYAVEKILEERTGRPASGVAGIYYRLRNPVEQQVAIASKEYHEKAYTGRHRHRGIAEDDKTMHAIIDTAIGYASEYVDGIARGRFPVEPKVPERSCNTCDFNTVCRIKRAAGHTMG